MKADKLASFRVDSHLWEQFQGHAKSSNTTATALLISYIKSVVNTGTAILSTPQSRQPVIDTAPKLSIQDIDERVDNCYQSMMTHLNELQSQIYALEQKMISKFDDISEKSSDSNDQSLIPNNQSPVTSPQPPITRSLVENIRTSLKRKGINASTEQIRAAFFDAGWDGSNYQEIRKNILDRLS